MVMSAGVDATGDLDLQRADLVLQFQRLEMGGDFLCHRDRPRRGQGAVIHAGAGDDIAEQPGIGGGQPVRAQHRVQRGQIGAVHMRQDDILLVADADFAVAIGLGQVRKGAHLVAGGIARRGPVRLQADGDDGMGRVAVGVQVGIGPGAKHRVGLTGGVIRAVVCLLQIRAFEHGADPGQVQHGFSGVEIRAQFGEPGIDQLADLLDPVFMHRDLDPRLVFVVAPAKQVVGADHGLEIRQQVGHRQEVAQHFADHRRAAQTAADDHLKPDRAVLADHAQADVMRAGHGAVDLGSGHRHLELARQELELGVVGGPLADQFGIGARIGDLVGCGAGEMVRSHVADRVARGLDGVQPDLGQRIQHVRHIGQARPVILDVLAGGEMAIALVPAIRDVGQHAHLARVQGPVGNRHAQHVGMQLQIQAVHQPQRPEFVLGQAAVKPAFHLRAELPVAFGQECVVKVIIAIHGAILWPWLACHAHSSRGRACGTPRENGWGRAPLR